VWLYLMKEKGEAGSHLQDFIALVKNQFNKHIKVIRTDNGTESNSRPMKAFY